MSQRIQSKSTDTVLKNSRPLNSVDALLDLVLSRGNCGLMARGSTSDGTLLSVGDAVNPVGISLTYLARKENLKLTHLLVHQQWS